jgi:hypothetical protein
VSVFYRAFSESKRSPLAIEPKKLNPHSSVWIS